MADSGVPATTADASAREERVAWLRRFVEFRRDPLNMLLGLHAEHGDVIDLAALSGSPRGSQPPTYMLCHPQAIERVLKTHQNNYRKGRPYGPLRTLLGNGLVTSEGPTWARHRRIAQRSFYEDSLNKLVPTMVSSCAPTIDRFSRAASDASTIDVAAEMTSLTLTIVGRALFQVDLSTEATRVGSALVTALDHFRKRFPLASTPSLLEWAEGRPNKENTDYAAAIDSLNRLVEGIITWRRSNPTEGHDLLKSLMEAEDDEGSRFSDLELRDETITFVLAGHETTANALSWTFHLLSQHPAIADDLHRELESVLGGADPTAEDVPRLKLTRSVISEALRLYPPLWVFERQAVEADQIGSQEIEAGATIVISPYVTHRHPEFWPEPDIFDPRRFLGEGRSARPPFAYFPFGGGRRQCIGAGFAMLESTILLAMIESRFRLKGSPDVEVRSEPRLTLRPRDGLSMTIEVRRQS